MTAGAKLRLVQLAAYSAGDTITPAQALAVIASVFPDPGSRLNPATLPELLHAVTPTTPRRTRRIAR